MPHSCCTCGKPTDNCYTDGGSLAMVHGQCRCRECYIKDGHPECLDCGELLSEKWTYCPHCGVLRVR